MKKGQVGAVIAIGIVVASSIIVYNALTATVDESKVYQQFNNAKQMMVLIDSTIKEMLYEAPGAMRVLRLDAGEGIFTVAGKEDSIKYQLEKLNLLEPGTRTREGNMIIQSGANMKAYESDINSDGYTELVLENDALLFAVSKIGEPKNHTFVNTTSMIKLMRNKITNTDVMPTSGIFINDFYNSSYGTGYTELTSLSSDAQSAGIHVYVDSQSGIKYDALFTLTVGMDYVEMRVSNIY